MNKAEIKDMETILCVYNMHPQIKEGEKVVVVVGTEDELQHGNVLRALVLVRSSPS